MKEFKHINATLSLKKYFDFDIDTSYTENDIDTTFELLKIVGDSVGRCIYDSLVPGYYMAIAGGWPHTKQWDQDTVKYVIASIDKACGPVRIVNIRIGADSTSILEVDLPAGERGWDNYDYYYKKTILWDGNIKANNW